MSAIADFIRLPASAVGQLRSNYDETIAGQGESVAQYDWSGYVFGTLLPYLGERGIQLMTSPYDELTAHLCDSRGATIFIFTPSHRDAYLTLLSPEHFSAGELRDYFNKFNACNEAEVGQAMLDGIASIQQSLTAIDGNSVILFSIG